MTVRIIGGKFKKRKLLTLPGNDTRPTADRLRESIFNTIFSFVPNAVALDLFAGSGAFGIEALSRGTDFVVFLDKNKQAVDIIKKNIYLCGLENRTVIMAWDILKNLNCLLSIQQEYDLVFMDPPYNKAMIHPALMHLKQTRKLKDGAILVIEHSSLEAVPDNISGFEIFDQRPYGKTTVSILTHHA